MDLIAPLGSEWRGSHFHSNSDENSCGDFTPLTVDSEQMTPSSHSDNLADIKSLARPIQPPSDIPSPFIKSHLTVTLHLPTPMNKTRVSPMKSTFILGKGTDPDLPDVPQPSTGLPMNENGSGSLLIPVTSFLSDQPSIAGGKPIRQKPHSMDVCDVPFGAKQVEKLEAHY